MPTQMKSTQAMRDRIRELMQGPQDDYDRAVECVLDDLEGILGGAQKPTVPPHGWVLVPKEPTDKMCEAMLERIEDAESGRGAPFKWPDIEHMFDVYTDAIAAIPEIPAPSDNADTPQSVNPSTANTVDAQTESGPDGYRAAWLEMIEHCNKIKEENFHLRTAKAVSISDFTDAQIATEHGWRMQRALGDQRTCVGAPVISTHRDGGAT